VLGCAHVREGKLACMFTGQKWLVCWAGYKAFGYMAQFKLKPTQDQSKKLNSNQNNTNLNKHGKCNKIQITPNAFTLAK
jgi:hypothetical protein